ncbi:unnamed protein product [Phaedon cochleariae]|uniref:Uncharacterized protein n=1 Tax=Phaedon cochleariae TaxID=80249 RepID=A0A9P0DI76_PHACE|nr:unnamed protein product [Phaedon cochleariae]
MKTLVLLSAIFACSWATITSPIINENIKLNRNMVDSLLVKYAEKASEGDTGVITAVVNNYADRLFQHIQTFAVSHSLDPVYLDDISENFLGSSLTLKNGTLNGISTISRYNDVKVTYQHNTRKLVTEFPLIFSKLNFVYQYHVLVLFIGPKGEMTGNIDNFKANVQLSFDFNTYTAKIEKLTTMDSGHISLTFHGQGLVDLVVNILSEFVTTILHPLLTAIIEGRVKDAASATVNQVNNFIGNLLHPNSTHNNTYIY